MTKSLKDVMSNLMFHNSSYYQLPDIQNVHIDTISNRFAGYGGDVKIGKAGKGLWSSYYES